MADAEMLTELREIKEHLIKMDKRDRLRTMGGFVRTIIGIVPVALLLWSTWYFFTHGDEILKKISAQAALSAANMAKESPEMFMSNEQLNEWMQNPAVREAIEKMKGQEGGE